MSVCTVAKLKGHVSELDLIDYLSKKYGWSDARYFTTDDFDEIAEIKERYDDSGRWKVTRGFIGFRDESGDYREIFYCYNNVNFHENLFYYLKYNLADMVKSETTYLSMGRWGNSVDIMTDIVQHFGGWVDDDDCDDNPYHYIEKVN